MAQLRHVGAATADADFTVIVAYMPVRQLQAGHGGFATAGELLAYTNAVWRSLAYSAWPIAAHGRILVAGDLNAEFWRSLRRYGRTPTAADARIRHLTDMARLQRIHPENAEGWTHTQLLHGRLVRSTIDHVLASPSMIDELEHPEVVDGVETGSNRHRALEVTLAPPDVIALHELGERPVTPARVCPAPTAATHDQVEQC